VRERDWAQFHDPKNLCMAIGSEAGELLAEYRWIQSDQADDWSQQPEARARIADEAADIGITLLLFCDRIGLDLTEAMQQKIEKNRSRYPVATSRGRHDRPSTTEEST